jgi:Flp pilus assembly protein TadG
MAPSSRPRHHERGTAAVEFALVLPLVLVMALALVQIGLLIRDRLLLESAVRAGARAAALEPDDAAARATAMQAAPSLDAAAMDVTVAREGAQGAPVTVKIGYTCAVRVPLVQWLFGASVAMTALATDRQEYG